MLYRLFGQQCGINLRWIACCFCFVKKRLQIGKELRWFINAQYLVKMCVVISTFLLPPWLSLVWLQIRKVNWLFKTELLKLRHCYCLCHQLSQQLFMRQVNQGNRLSYKCNGCNNEFFAEDPSVCACCYKLFSNLRIGPSAWYEVSWFALWLVQFYNMLAASQDFLVV